MTVEELKSWIDNASYEELLHRWRFAPVGDPIFSGDIGNYYSKVMQQKLEANPQEHVNASKNIGW